MAHPALAKEEVVARLMKVFRREGYEGASLSRLSEATGLGRSSLYHHFPRGKEDMAAAVLDLARAPRPAGVGAARRPRPGARPARSHGARLCGIL